MAKPFIFLLLYFVCHLNSISVTHNPDYPWTMKLSGAIRDEHSESLYMFYLTGKAFIQVIESMLQVSEYPLSSHLEWGRWDMEWQDHEILEGVKGLRWIYQNISQLEGLPKIVKSCSNPGFLVDQMCFTIVLDYNRGTVTWRTLCCNHIFKKMHAKTKKYKHQNVCVQTLKKHV